MKLYLDGPSLDDIERYHADSAVQGFTTNPTLLRQIGVTNYLEFAHTAVRLTG